MKDSAILGSGNSRYLKSVADFKTLYPTYDDFAAALVAGTLPIDLNGINRAGFQQVGDALGKEILLKDTTAALYGMDADAVPDDVLAFLSKSIIKNEIMSHTWDVGATGAVEIDLTSIDFTKRVFVELDTGENDSLFWTFGLSDQGNFIISDMYSFQKETHTGTNSLPFSPTVYKGRPLRFELICTGNSMSGNIPYNLQFDLRYDNQLQHALCYSGYGISYLRLDVSRAPTKSGAKITVYTV